MNHAIEQSGLDQRGLSPAELYGRIELFLRACGRSAIVHFSVENGKSDFSPSYIPGKSSPDTRMPDAMAEAMKKITPALVACEVEEFDMYSRVSGRLIFDRDGVWLDAEDLDGDWDYTRDVDLDALAYTEFPDWCAGAEVEEPAVS